MYMVMIGCRDHLYYYILLCLSPISDVISRRVSVSQPSFGWRNVICSKVVLISTFLCFNSVFYVPAP